MWIPHVSFIPCILWRATGQRRRKNLQLQWRSSQHMFRRIMLPSSLSKQLLSRSVGLRSEAGADHLKGFTNFPNFSICNICCDFCRWYIFLLPLQARSERPVKDNISQKPPVTQVPPKPTDGEPAAKQNNLPAPTQQSKHSESLSIFDYSLTAIVQKNIVAAI